MWLDIGSIAEVAIDTNVRECGLCNEQCEKEYDYIFHIMYLSILVLVLALLPLSLPRPKMGTNFLQ